MKQVAIIEDDPYFVEDLSYFLKKNNINVSYYNSADAVFNNFGKIANCDCVILDIMMLRGNHLKDDKSDWDTGEILYKILRNKYPEKFIIIVSAKNFDEMKVDFDKDKYVEKVIKPLDLDLVNRIVNIIVGRDK